MADHQKMYTLLFNATTQAIEALQAAQQAAAEMYVASPPVVLRLADADSAEDDGDDTV